jgi:hypothetical protein
MIHFMAILSTLRPNGIFYGYLVHFVAIYVYFSRFGMLFRKRLATLLSSIYIHAVDFTNAHFACKLGSKIEKFDDFALA